MLGLIYGFIASDYWDLVAGALTIWGVFALIMLLLGFAATRGRRLFAWTGIVAMIGVVIFSMLFEDFLPGLESGRTGADSAVGMVAIFVGTCIFAYGGYRFVRDTFSRMGTAKGPRFGRARKRGAGTEEVEIEHVPVAGWLRIWGPALLWMGGGFLLIALGASLNNENRFPFAWFWGWFGI